MKKVCQKDIADSLGVSRVTVTKALQGHPDIAKKTIQCVREKANEMGYIPDFIGRSLSSRRTFNIGLVIPKIAHSFFSYSLERMYESARVKGYNMIPMVSFEDKNSEIENIRTLLSMRVDGIILDIAQNSQDPSSLELAGRTGCKVIFFDRCPANYTTGSIVTDDRQGAYHLTTHMITKGYRRILFISGPSFLNITKERKTGYELAMKDHSLVPWVTEAGMKREGGYQALMKLAGSGEIPDAVFGINDPVAHGVYDAVRELGLSIPGDIAVAGFGDIDASVLLNPPMTSVRPPLDKMAKAAVDTIINMIENNMEAPEQQVFASKLTIRHST